MARHARDDSHASPQQAGADAYGEKPRARHAKPSEGESATDPADDASRYSRDNYGSGACARGLQTQPGRKRAGLAKRIAIGVACALGVIVLAVGAYALWFSQALDKALAPSDEDRASTQEQLVSAPLDKPFYMLLLGSDSREGAQTSNRADQQGSQQRSDVIMLVRVDPISKKVTMVTVPRDTPYTLADGRMVKINEAYNIGGAAESIKAVSQLTGVDIAHYAEVHVSELEAIVDAVGGVDVYVDKELSVKDTHTGELVGIPAGQQTLNGQQAQVFARARHEYADTEEGQDYHRQSNVRTLMQAIINKVLDRPVTQLPGVILDLAKYVTTDLHTGDLVSLGMSFAGGGITMYSCCGPIDGDFLPGGEEVWMCYPNPEGWAELIRQVDSGEKPGKIDYAATQQPFEQPQEQSGGGEGEGDGGEPAPEEGEPAPEEGNEGE